MRIVLCLAALLVAGVANAQESLTFVPLQMPDGSKLFRLAGKIPKGEEAEMRLTDLIAQALGRGNWCPNGWEETKRSPGTMGVSLIEGRCK